MDPETLERDFAIAEVERHELRERQRFYQDEAHEARMQAGRRTRREPGPSLTRFAS